MEVRIKCENTNTEISVKAGTTLKDVAEQNFNNTIGNMPILAALVDNKLKSLDYDIINPHNVRFIGHGFCNNKGRRFIVLIITNKESACNIFLRFYEQPSAQKREHFDVFFCRADVACH